MLVNNGDDDINNRDNFFNSLFNCFGVGISDHVTFGACVVIDFAGGLVPKNKEDGILKLDFEQEMFEEIKDARTGIFKKAKKVAKPIIKHEAIKKASGGRVHYGPPGAGVPLGAHAQMGVTPHHSKKTTFFSWLLNCCSSHKVRRHQQPKAHVVIV